MKLSAAPASSSRFAVAWQLPADLQHGDEVLSFLSPAEERAIADVAGHPPSMARALANAMRSEVIDLLVRICVGIGTVVDGGGRTFRQALVARPGESSDWWFHPLSWKMAATHDRQTLEWMLITLVIDRWAAQRGARELHCYGAPSLLIGVLRRKYAVVEHATRRSPWRVHGWPLEAIVQRGWALTWAWSSMRRSKRVPSPMSAGPTLALTGHPWLRWNGETFVDGHFKGLVEAFARRGWRAVRYLWLLPGDRGITSPDRAAAAIAGGDAIAIQSFISLADVAGEVLSLRPLAVYLRWRGRPELRRLFRVDDLDLFPYFRIPLASGFAGAQIPLARLGATATARAVAAHRPVASMCHFEVFAEGRSHYEGVRRSGVPVVTATMQHGANTKVAFYRIDPVAEFAGRPDRCAAPHAEHVFVMGPDGRDCFVAAGYGPGAVWSTGTTRFGVSALRDEVRRRRRGGREPGPLRMLVLVSSLSRDAELIEAAHSAADGLPQVEVHVRRKPGTHSVLRASTLRVAKTVRLTEGTLAEDLAGADVVLFSASTAAEQALACGVPTWQWLPLNIAGASLADVVPIPQFHTIADLRSALLALQRDAAAFALRESDVDAVVTRVLGAVDGGEADRIAARLCALAGAGDVATAGVTPTASRPAVALESR